MGHRRVLLVEDAGPPRDAMVRLLSSEGHDVRSVDAIDAADHLADFRPDTVVYGADPSDDASRRVVEELEMLPPNLRFIALGTEPERGTGRFPPPLGGRVTIPRPVNLEELRRVLREE